MDNYFKKLAEEATKNNFIEQKKYDYFQVKRGLRNENGTGVLVGLTNIASVIGYEKVDEEIIPLDGRLYYRGFDIRDLVHGLERANRLGFEEISYLLLFGELPKKDELTKFEEELAEKRHLPLNFSRDILQTYTTQDVMNDLSRAVLSLYSLDDIPDDLSVVNQTRQAVNLIAKMNTLVPYLYYSMKHHYGGDSLIIHSPNNSLNAAENFLYLMRADNKFTELEAKVLDMVMLLQMDHGGGNNSTFASRVVSSTNTDFYSAMAAALGALRGVRHGGDNLRVALMMEEIAKAVGEEPKVEKVRECLSKILDKKAFDETGLIYGIGHHVYTISDPRVVIIKRYASQLAKEKGREANFELYKLVEKEAIKLIIEKNNNPEMVIGVNQDFYSSFIYDCLGIPKDLYIPMFALSRFVGWCSHRVEMMANRGKVIRPAYKSISKKQQYVPMEER